jgi:hypothetical protein
MIKERETRMDDRPGCLGGLLRIGIISAAYTWLQKNLGFGRGGCGGVGCGVILILLLIVLLCGTCTGTNWFDFSF